MTEYWRFFLVQSGPIYDGLADWKRRRLQAAQAMREFAAARGAKDFFVDFTGALCAITHLHPIPRGWKIGGRRKERIEPNRTDEGKAELALIAALPKIPSEIEIATLIGMPLSFSYEVPNSGIRGRRSYAPGPGKNLDVGWVGEFFCLLVPDHDAALANLRARHPDAVVNPADIWTVPPGLKRITEWQWKLVVARYNVALDEAAQRAVAAEAAAEVAP